jgi:hypothetical protein
MQPRRGDVWEREKDHACAIVDYATSREVHYTVFPEKQGYKKTLDDFLRNYTRVRAATS